MSVVIASHRGERYLREALASVGSQSRLDWELLVVDDHPAAPAEGVVREFARGARGHRVEYLRGQAAGPGAARNLGISASRGSHLAFLDEDDLWEAGHLAAALAVLESSEADLAYSPVEMFDDETARALGLWGPTVDELDGFPVGLYLRNYIGIQSVVLCRHVVDRHGLFDPGPLLRYGEDHEYWVRLAFGGVRFVKVPGVHGRYRKGHPSGTSDVVGLQEVHARVYRRHLAGALARSADPHHVRATVAARHAELALSLARARRWRALRYAFWALRISPEPGRMLRSGFRRAFSGR